MIGFFILVGLLSPAIEASSCECGLENISTRVFKGNETSPNKYPWLVLIESTNVEAKTVSICGGSLVDHEHVITAAHCMFRDGKLRDPANTKLLVGLHRKDKVHSSNVYYAKSFQFAQGYLRDTRGMDFAFIKLTKPVEFSRTVSPICLKNIPVKAGDKVVVAGWGARDPQKPVASNTPYEAELDVLSNAECNKRKAKYLEQTDQLRYLHVLETPEDICALNLETSSDACHGDSGGPLMKKDPQTGRWTLIGLVSRAWDECGTYDYMPGIYTGMRKYLSHFKNSCSME